MALFLTSKMMWQRFLVICPHLFILSHLISNWIMNLFSLTVSLAKETHSLAFFTVRFDHVTNLWPMRQYNINESTWNFQEVFCKHEGMHFFSSSSMLGLEHTVRAGILGVYLHTLQLRTRVGKEIGSLLTPWSFHTSPELAWLWTSFIYRNSVFALLRPPPSFIKFIYEDKCTPRRMNLVSVQVVSNLK